MPRARKPRGQHGGPRQGAVGGQYQNRSDLQQAPRAVSGQTYGEAGAQLASQQVIPLPVAGAPGAGQPAGGPAPGPTVPTPPPLTAPTMQPGTPLTAGIAGGAGPGPEALDIPLPITDPTIHVLQGILQAYPNPDVQALLDQAQSPG